MLLTIDPHSAEPIFEQIAFSVKEAVARGDLGPGAQLPSVRELAQDLSVNPNTVVRAYELLTREGVVVRRLGAGCFNTGRPRVLSGRHGRRQLVDLVSRTVTEAFHLGFDAEDVRAAVEQALVGIRFDGKSKEQG
jgi:GntR family transcriptional regulator